MDSFNASILFETPPNPHLEGFYLAKIFWLKIIQFPTLSIKTSVLTNIAMKNLLRF